MAWKDRGDGSCLIVKMVWVLKMGGAPLGGGRLTFVDETALTVHEKMFKSSVADNLGMRNF